MKYILTADIGTTALKTALYSQDGDFIAGCSREYAFVTPEPGQAELAAEVYTETFAAGIQSLLSDTGIDPSDIGVIGFSTFAEQSSGAIPGRQKRRRRSRSISD